MILTGLSFTEDSLFITQIVRSNLLLVIENIARLNLTGQRRKCKEGCLHGDVTRTALSVIPEESRAQHYLDIEDSTVSHLKVFH